MDVTSLSAQIQRERKAYYDILERTQKRSMDVTEWLAWFLDALHHAVDQAQHTLDAVLTKARFWQRGSNENTNGLLRQYLPKGTDLSVYSQDELNQIALSLNTRPRQRHGFHTPLQVYNEHLRLAEATLGTMH